MSDRIIRASEISEYVYCRRAWWLRRSYGYASENMQELAAGRRYHQDHGSMVVRATLTQRLALVVFFVAISAIVYWLLQVI